MLSPDGEAGTVTYVERTISVVHAAADDLAVVDEDAADGCFVAFESTLGLVIVVSDRFSMAAPAPGIASELIKRGAANLHISMSGREWIVLEGDDSPY